MIMVILQPTLPMGPYTALTCGRAGMGGGIHSGSTGTTTIMVITIPISGVGIRPDLEVVDTPVIQSSQKDS